MNRLVHLENLKQNQNKAIILFLTAGDPDLETTLHTMKAMADSGVDCIEIGVPFSDPVADGPVIQASTNRALKNKVNLTHILKLVQDFRKIHSTPVVLMGYFNPIIRYGIENFVKDCNEKGVDGLIIADLPYEEGETFEIACQDHDISLIYLLAPDVDYNRACAILKSSSGFVYCVSHYGTTGKGENAAHTLSDTLNQFRNISDLPLAIGFGISSVESAIQAAQIADGIIIGSWFIDELNRSNDKPKAATEFIMRLKNALK